MIHSLKFYKGSSMNIATFSKASLASIIFLLCQACSLTVPVTNPDYSKTPYTSNNNVENSSVAIVDGLGDKHNISQGKVIINISHNGQSIDTMSYVKESIESELKARGVPLVLDESSVNKLILEKFEIFNNRVSGFSPMVTLSTAKAKLTFNGKEINVAAFVKRAKVPVWTMNEINEPCFNEPLQVLIKEIVAKINMELFNYSLTDQEVNKLGEKINSESGENKLSYLDVYELGFSNNKSALKLLRKLSTSTDEYIRLAAISSLGILKDNDSMSDLKKIYADGSSWQDRGMALKAIADIGSQDSIDFLKQEKSKWDELSTREAKWNSMIISLYI